MKEIILTQDRICIIDDEDYELINSYPSWYAAFNPTSRHYYACSYIKTDDGKVHTVKMHRLIMNAPDGVLVDHRNLNTLDNRRQNLRLCNGSESCRNRGMMSNNTSGYKGVSFHIGHGKFQAAIRLHRKPIHLGYYLTAEEASAAYKEAALRLHGEFARTE